MSTGTVAFIAMALPLAVLLVLAVVNLGILFSLQAQFICFLCLDGHITLYILLPNMNV